MDEVIIVKSEDIHEEYFQFVDVSDFSVTNVSRPFIESAKETYYKIEKALYSAPSLINVIKARIPKETLQAILTNEQRNQIAKGALKLMTKKDGSLMANLVNPKTNKIVSTVSLENVKISPEISQSMTSYATQMQMAQIAEQIHLVQVAIEEVRQGQENDRLAIAYSCQQKLLQALTIKNPELKQLALLRIAFDAEDSRNILMQSQSVNVSFIKSQPESTIGKIMSGATPDKIESRMNEIRDNLSAINMVSLTEAIVYQEMGEIETARLSLEYYSKFISSTYLEHEGLVERFDLIDPSPKNYWSKTLPEIKRKIQALPCNKEYIYIGDEKDGKEV